jgi:hypothetical protein
MSSKTITTTIVTCDRCGLDSTKIDSSNPFFLGRSQHTIKWSITQFYAPTEQTEKVIDLCFECTLKFKEFLTISKPVNSATDIEKPKTGFSIVPVITGSSS